VLARKPGALRNGAPFKDWLAADQSGARAAQTEGSDDSDRQMVKMLSRGAGRGLAF